jgi:hypothetical protein
MDYWYFFAHKAFDILKRDGHLCFIASNYYPSSTGGVKLNEYLARNTTIKNYIDFNKIMVFDTADVQTMILLVENQPTEKSGIAIKFNTNDRTSIGAGLHNYQNSNCVDVFEIERTANLLNTDKQLVFVKSESSVILDKMDSLRATDLIKSTQGVVENPNVVNTSNYKILKASGENIDNIQDLSGYKVGSQLGTLTDSIIDQISGVNHVTPYDTFNTAALAVSSGTIDAMTAEYPVAKAICKANSDLTIVTFAPENGFSGLDENELGVAVAVKEGNSELQTQINEALSELSLDDRRGLMDGALDRAPSEE